MTAASSTPSTPSTPSGYDGVGERRLRRRHARGRHEAPGRWAGGTLTGTLLVARLAARRSRVFWPAWILATAALLPATVSAYAQLVPDSPAGAATITALQSNPTMRAMLGPPHDLSTAGGFAMWRVGTFVAAAAAMMAALGVIRATRAEEEEGRVELVRAGAIGRHAPLAGGLVVALAACLLLAVIITATMAAGAPPLPGALATGLGVGLVAAVWAGVGAVAAQLVESARAARFLALGTLGAAYLLRALADGTPTDSAWSPLGWLSPVQWAALSRPYADERWWVLALPALSTAGLIALAFALESRRDHGSGIRATPPGPGRAAAWLSGAGALAWRLERGAIIGWGVGLGMFALVIGSLSTTVDQLLKDNPQLADMFRRMGQGGQVLRDAFFVAMLGILVVVIAFFAASLILRLRREEESGHVELLGSTATSRTRLLAAHVLPALLAPTVLLVVCGALVAVPQALSGDGAALIAGIAGAALALAPGLWLVVGLATALLGWAPRLLGLVWVVLGWSLFVTWVGALLDLPQAALDATPFAALPQLPVQSLAWTPILVETGLAVALLAVGALGWRRRDLGAA